MVFVLFALPLALGAARTAVWTGNRILDGLEAKKKLEDAGEDEFAHVSIDVVLPATLVADLLRDPRIVEGTTLAQQLRTLGVTHACPGCGR